MRYSIEWHEDGRNAALEERATVADFRLFLQDQNVTLHLSGEQLFDHLTISLYGLAEGLAHDWWTLFGGRDRGISLTRYRNGYAVPDIRMSFDGAAFEVSAQQYAYRNPDIRFWAGVSEVMDRQTAEAQITTFIVDVLDRLDARNVPGTNAALRWKRVQESRADPDEAEFCEAAGALGIDPYRIGDEDTALIEKAAALFEGETLTEFLAGIDRAERDRLTDWIGSAERRPRHKARLADLAVLAAQTVEAAPARVSEPGWSLGYRRAATLRSILELRADERFQTYRALAEKLGASRSFELARHVDGLRALRSERDDGIYIHMREHGRSADARASHLFTFARAVGDAVCFPGTRRAPVNDLHSAFRQATGRAFAAELLAPARQVGAMREEGRDFVSIAEWFGVSTTAIERQWENRDRIESAV